MFLYSISKLNTLHCLYEQQDYASLKTEKFTTQQNG